MIIKMNDDKSLLITIPTTIYRGESNADLITFLVPAEYQGRNMATCEAIMQYIIPNGVGYSDDLCLLPQPYKNYLQFVLPITTCVTKQEGLVTLWLTFIDSANNMVLDTGEIDVLVSPNEDISDSMPQEGLDLLDRIAVQIAALEEKVGTDTVSEQIDAKIDATIAAKIGEVDDGKTIAEMIADIQTVAYDDTQIKADIKANTDAIAAEIKRATAAEEAAKAYAKNLIDNLSLRDMTI